MNIEHKAVTFEVDERLQDKVDALEKEGWHLLPDTKPTITYNLVRVVPGEGSGIVGKLLIDDSQITVIRAGEQS